MENLGSMCLLLALCLAVYAMAASVVAAWKRRPLLAASAERSIYAVWFCVSCASAILVGAFLTNDYRFAYVAENSNRAMAASYKFAAWWGGQEGSLLFWSWLLASYSALAVYRSRRGGPAPLILVLAGTEAFFLLFNAFIASPFRMLAVDGATVSRWRGAKPPAAVPHDAHPPPDSLSGVRGNGGAVCILHESPGHAAARVRLAALGAPMDSRHLAFPRHRDRAGGALGLCRAGLGRILELGSGRERLFPAVVEFDGLSPLRDDAGEEGHAARLECGAGFVVVLSLHFWHDDDPGGSGGLRTCLRQVIDRKVFRVVSGGGNCVHGLADSTPPGLPEKRCPNGERDCRGSPVSC
jgi:hypothetical protein